MCSNFLQEQRLLNRAYLKNYLLGVIITCLITLTAFGNLALSGHTKYNLTISLLPRFIIFAALVPTLSLVILAILKFRITDILRCQTRKVLIFQIIYRVTLVCLIMGATWLIGSLLVVVVSGFGDIFAEIWGDFLLRALYLWLSCFTFGLMTATFYLICKNKVVTFLLIFAVSGLSFYLNISKKISLFYDFIRPDFAMIMLQDMLILLGIILLLLALLTITIKHRDF